MVLHRDEARPAVAVREVEGLANCHATSTRRRGSGPCPPARRRAAPPGSLRSASRVPAVNLVEVDVVRPRRRRLASSSWKMSLRERPRRWARAIAPWTLVATTISSRRARSLSARPVTSSLTPAEYMSAVSKKLMPASRARLKNGRASSSRAPTASARTVGRELVGIAVAHASEADAGDLEAGVAESCVFYRGSFQGPQPGGRASLPWG